MIGRDRPQLDQVRPGGPGTADRRPPPHRLHRLRAGGQRRHAAAPPARPAQAPGAAALAAAGDQPRSPTARPGAGRSTWHRLAGLARRIAGHHRTGRTGFELLAIAGTPLHRRSGQYGHQVLQLGQRLVIGRDRRPLDLAQTGRLCTADRQPPPQRLHRLRAGGQHRHAAAPPARPAQTPDAAVRAAAGDRPRTPTARPGAARWAWRCGSPATTASAAPASSCWPAQARHCTDGQAGTVHQVLQLGPLLAIGRDRGPLD